MTGPFETRMDDVTVDQALETIREHVPRLKTETLATEQAAGNVLAENIAAREPSPLFSHSTTDGYAIQWQDIRHTQKNKPNMLRVIGESRPGAPFTAVPDKGCAIRVYTGAFVPRSTDTVIPIEHVEQIGDHIHILQITKKGEFVRKQGSEFKTGDKLLKSGTLLTPGYTGLLVSQGITNVKVICHPTVSLVITGSELVPPDLAPKAGQVRDANSTILVNALNISQANIGFHTRSGDNFNAIRQAINKAAENSDVVLVSGGESAGPHDLVRAASMEAGFEKLFWGVRQKPGKGLYFAKRGHTLLFGLPGNMVSALNCYAYYIHPLLRKMTGKAYQLKTFSGILSKQVANPDDRTRFLRVRLDENGVDTMAVPMQFQESQMLSSIGGAHGFVLVPPQSSLEANTNVAVNLYPWYRT